MLRYKIWTCLLDVKLKIPTRNKYDSICDYHRLLKEVCSMEHELSASSSISATVNTAQQSPAVEKKIVVDPTSKMDLLINKMPSLETDETESKGCCRFQ
ncbi:hypothetical protein DPMN_161641 [Dreissena polymorpha]|uniref:Uncharacterized protein n=1 Tax=Dreissena polymorpha TaxID=45954 RepID=A0A9D4EQ37_DREPO|nr:hypothetical protein DPMN_161641 [Dreissena polymorpha]